MTLDLSTNGLRIREFSVVIAAQNHNPTILNPDFLARNEIVNSTWALAEAPVCVEPFARVKYANGITITSELDKLVFTQTGDSLTENAIEIHEMAQRYIVAVPHVDYRGLGINPKGDIEFSTEEACRRYIVETLIASGPWQTYGKAPVKASTRFLFELEGVKLFLTIQEAKAKRRGGDTSPVVMFAANFHYELSSIAREQVLEMIKSALDKWQICWKEYIHLISAVFRPKEP